MFRNTLSVLRAIRPLQIPYYSSARIIGNEIRNYKTINIKSNLCGFPCFTQGSLINNKQLLEIASNFTPTSIPIRTVTKFSLKKGKRKTVKAALKRFYRLDWGGWIRTKCGRNKKLWKKSSARKRRLRQHVFVNATQSTLLDKMVTKFWKKPKYYVDDIYSPYHTREEFPITRKKPKVY